MGQRQYFVKRADGDQMYVRQPDGTYNLADVVDSFQLGLAVSATLENLGAGPTEAGGEEPVDLTDYTEMRFGVKVVVAGVTGVVRLSYFNGSAFVALTANTAALAATGVVRTGWETIPTAARTMTTVKPEAVGGNGSEDPELGPVVAEFRR